MKTFFENGHSLIVKEVKYFSPDGRKTIPDGHGIQKAGFLRECKLNSEKFTIKNIQYLINEDFEVVEAVRVTQYVLEHYRGGVIVFSTDVNSLEVSKSKLFNWLTQKFKTINNKLFSKKKLNKVINKFNQDEKVIGDKKIEDFIGAFSIGSFFNGRYIGDNGKVFDENSMSIEVNGISNDALIYLAEKIAMEFNQETVLVKDLDYKKIFLVSQVLRGGYDKSSINK